MDAKLQRRVQRYGWNKAAGAYRAGWRDQLSAAQSRMLDLACRLKLKRSWMSLAARGSSPWRQLRSVGPPEVSGDGHRRPHGGSGRSAPMRRLCTRLSVAWNAEDLQIGDGIFSDVALCALGVDVCPRSRKGGARAIRVLRPGGRAAAAVLGTSQSMRLGRNLPDRRLTGKVRGLSAVLSLGSGDALR